MLGLAPALALDELELEPELLDVLGVVLPAPYEHMSDAVHDWPVLSTQPVALPLPSNV